MDLSFQDDATFQPVLEPKPIDATGIVEPLGEALAGVGAGGFANGLVWFDHPEAFQETFAPWVNPRPGITMTPFGRTAFGNVLYVAYTDGIPPSPGVLDVHYKTMRPAAPTVEMFFGSILMDAEWRDAELQTADFARALEAHGPLKSDQCYAYVPALALGGSPSGPFDKSHWGVHMELLRQL